jgi:hypothetical protein
MAYADIHNHFPRATIFFSPDREKISEGYRLCVGSLVAEFCRARGVAKIAAARDGRERRLPADDEILLRLLSKFFAVDRIRREDYGIIGESRDGRFAKSFFAGSFSISLFRSDE